MSSRASRGPAAAEDELFYILELLEFARHGVDYESADDDIFRHQWMVLDQMHAAAHRLLHVVEAAEPRVQIDVAILHHIQLLGRDAVGADVLQHYLAVHVLRAAIGVAYNHDLLDTEFVYAHQQTAHHAAEGVGNGAARVLYHLHVAVADAQGGGDQLDQAGIHAGHDGDLLVGILVRKVGLITLLRNEGAVILY